MKTKTFKPGDLVYALFWPTAVVVEVPEGGDPVIEAWGYGRALGPMPAHMMTLDKTTSFAVDARHWFKVAVDAAVRMYGEQARPTHEVSKALYAAAVEDKEAIC